ncbi:unnamed protein product [Schistosoma curassoni]|uniref:Fibrillar collagen NC1 domain-containing protein n=1 Tax=Schistosoma curassoni TaxID=6186 RepID=A0A183KWA0_9TREM|nr:unnamed protein product [Schistosoma curassoni]
MDPGSSEHFFKTKKDGITMNVIQCYALTNDSIDQDQFYESLQSTIAQCPGREPHHPDGMDRSIHEGIMGRHGLEETNENGDRFAYLMCI